MKGGLKLKDIEKEIREYEIEDALERLYGLKKEYGSKLDRLIERYLKKREDRIREKCRYDQMCTYEKDAYARGIRIIAGVDEAGRGPLAGPVVAAAVILPQGIFIEKLNDSKRLTPKQRDRLYEAVTSSAVAYGIGVVDEKCIDEINILNASKKAMEIAIGHLKPQPELLLTDAVKLEKVRIKQMNIIKGDSLSISIAAASIIAKVTRDRLIENMDSLYPQYGFSKHKGYGTKEHIEAIKKYGICPIHRISFTKNFI
ncbi:MAG: ribonuclease HII [Clostridiales bacterium]|nr:ribonuclease HII [Eubacteriales bacterium]MDH7565117.1 ribonuclease HII [Clostridiales bacterium]